MSIVSVVLYLGKRAFCLIFLGPITESPRLGCLVQMPSSRPWPMLFNERVKAQVSSLSRLHPMLVVYIYKLCVLVLFDSEKFKYAHQAVAAFPLFISFLYLTVMYLYKFFLMFLARCPLDVSVPVHSSAMFPFLLPVQITYFNLRLLGHCSTVR